VAFEPFDRRDALAILHHGKRHARKNAATVDEHRAGTTFAAIARFLGAREVQFVAQCVEQRRARLDRHAASLLIDDNRYRYAWQRLVLRFGGDRIASVRERHTAPDKAGELHEFTSIDRHTPSLRRYQVPWMVRAPER